MTRVTFPKASLKKTVAGKVPTFSEALLPRTLKVVTVATVPDWRGSPGGV